MNASPSSPTRSSVVETSFAWNAIHAGHVARAAVVKEKRRMQQRNEHASLSGVQDQEEVVTAENWVSFWGRESNQRWQDEALGAGTPLVCLYLLGYYWGKHRFGLIFAAVLFILPCWGGFLYQTLAHGDESFWNMWMAIITFLILSAMVFFARIAKGTPNGVPLFSADVWVGLCLETLLANTLTCAVHVLAIMSDERRDAMEEAYWIGRIAVVMCPFGLWLLLNNQALDIQAATLTRQNMATRHGGGRGCIPSYQGRPQSWEVVSRCLVAIIKNSRDLRVTGLSREQLERLAALMDDRKEAHYIRFFTSGGREYPNAFDVLYAFYQGYTYERDRAGGYEGDRNRDYERVRHSMDNWQRTQIGSDPLAAITRLSQATEPQDCSDALAAICPVHGQNGQNRWLCGLIAKAWDELVADSVAGLPRPSDGSAAEKEAKSINVEISHQFFALLAAALTVNRNPLTVIQMGDVKSQATEMEKIMEIGCEQVLRQTTEDEFVYIGRGLILYVPSNAEETAPGTRNRPDDSPPVVTYSMGEVWQAEQRRETVMIEKRSFNRFWRALVRDNRILNPQERWHLLQDSVKWSEKVVIHVDYGRAFASLGPEGRALVNVRAAARQGWCTHTLWVALSIYLHFYFQEHLFAMALLSIAVLALIKADQYAQLLYVGCRLWRSYMGRICLFVPPMIDEDIDALTSYLFWTVIFMVNLGGAYLGSIAQTPIETALFLSLLLSSIVPGLWYCVLCEDKGAEGGRSVVSYVGRKRGEGYEHRDTPERFRPLGKDVLERVRVESPTRNVSTDHDVGPARVIEVLSSPPKSGGSGPTSVC